jgi:N-acetylglucosamine-6-phosphate deacetylase
MKGFKNCNVYVYKKGIINCSLGFESGIIKYLGDDQNMITEPIEIPENAVILPGFIDQHVHGAAGSDAMDGTKEALKTIANSLATEGTTSFLATTLAGKGTTLYSFIQNLSIRVYTITRRYSLLYSIITYIFNFEKRKRQIFETFFVK